MTQVARILRGGGGSVKANWFPCSTIGVQCDVFCNSRFPCRGTVLLFFLVAYSFPPFNSVVPLFGQIFPACPHKSHRRDQQRALPPAAPHRHCLQTATALHVATPAAARHYTPPPRPMRQKPIGACQSQDHTVFSPPVPSEGVP